MTRKQAEKKAIKELKEFFKFSYELQKDLVPFYSPKAGKLFYLKNVVVEDNILCGKIVEVKFYDFCGNCWQEEAYKRIKK